MLSIQRVLLPVDFSHATCGALRYARSLSEHFRSELTLLHVLPPPTYWMEVPEFAGPRWGDILDSLRKSALDRMGGYVGSFSEELRGRSSMTVQEGDPAVQIVEAAHRQDVDLIVMPTHGYGSFRRFLLGSVTSKVLHDVRCPVMTGAHMQETPSTVIFPPKNIVCSVDLGEHSVQVVDWAARCAREFGAQLHLLHTVNPLGSVEDPVFLKEAARLKLEKLKLQAHREAEIAVAGGEPDKVLASMALERHADLVVIGRSTHDTPLGRLRTMAYSIIRQAPCPVVSV